jgi:hypothetical protein
VHRLPLEENIVGGLHVGQTAPNVEADARLRIFFGERPELTG